MATKTKTKRTRSRRSRRLSRLELWSHGRLRVAYVPANAGIKQGLSLTIMSNERNYFAVWLNAQNADRLTRLVLHEAGYDVGPRPGSVLMGSLKRGEYVEIVCRASNPETFMVVSGLRLGRGQATARISKKKLVELGQWLAKRFGWELEP